MKSHFSRVLALGVLICASLPSSAQPIITLQENAENYAENPVLPGMPAFKSTESNQYALAMIGAFVDKLRHTGNYSGQLTITKTNFKDEKIVSRLATEIQESYVVDAKNESRFSKIAVRIVTSEEFDGKIAVKSFRKVDDGTKVHFVFDTKKTWSERNHQANDIPEALRITSSQWMNALGYFAVGEEFKIERKVINKRDSYLITSSYMEYVFDAKERNLQSLRVFSDTVETKFLWSHTKFNVTLPDSQFKWIAPQGAVQVAVGKESFTYSY